MARVSPSIPLVEARHLSWSCAGMPVQQDLSFTLNPGLGFVQGGEGRGKSSLLRLLAGELQPDGGELRVHARTTLFPQPTRAAFDAIPAAQWLAALRPQFPAWDEGVLAALVAGFALDAHMAKPLFMLSAGTRRKVGLVAAAAAQAELTLLDLPYAALDAASGRFLTRLLSDVARDTRRAWVVADYTLPQGLQQTPLSTRIELGD